MYTDDINAQIVLSLLKKYGVRKIVVSPGTTNVPIARSVQADLMPLEKGLSKELKDFKEKAARIKPSFVINGAMDRATKSKILLNGASLREKALYICGYLGCFNTITTLVVPLSRMKTRLKRMF